MKICLILFPLALALLCGVCHGAPVELAEFRALSRPEPTATVRYGMAPSQAIDLFLPNTPRPYPLVILIHGGCWSAQTAGREQLRHLATELAKLGIAVWSIGYRRADEPGGGYPGTFQDVALAIDLARLDAAQYGFDLPRSVLVGHSAGGHLALWAAARDRLRAGSPLRTDHPFVPRRVISLAGVGDLRAFARLVPIVCGPGIIDKLLPARFSNDDDAETSPAALPPPGGSVTLVSGVLDRLVPPFVAYDYALAMARKHAATPELIDIAGAGHFDLVTPGAPAWTEVRCRIARAVGVSPRSITGGSDLRCG